MEAVELLKEGGALGIDEGQGICWLEAQAEHELNEELVLSQAILDGLSKPGLELGLASGGNGI
jgi:hypothetical protein